MEDFTLRFISNSRGTPRFDAGPRHRLHPLFPDEGGGAPVRIAIGPDDPLINVTALVCLSDRFPATRGSCFFSP